MTKRELIKHVRKIVYEHDADPDMIQLELLRFHLEKDLFTHKELLGIINAACVVCDADRGTILSKHKGGRENLARYFIWKYVRENRPKTSHGAIGRITGGQSSSSVLTGINTLNNDISNYTATRDAYERFVGLLIIK